MRRSNSLTYDSFNGNTITTSSSATKPSNTGLVSKELSIIKDMEKVAIDHEASSPPSISMTGDITPTKKLVGALRKTPATGAGSPQLAKKPRKVNFSESVRVVRIPSHKEYSSRVRDQYWASAEEIYEMACRNLVEFDMEGHDWENVAEETQMIWCEEVGALVHPAHFECYDQYS